MAVQDIEKSMLNRIRGSGRGWCFTSRDFADLGSAAAVWTALHRLNRRGTIRRLGRGLYDFPRTHAEFGTLSPDPEAVAEALARSRHIRILPTAAYAANLLGLTGASIASRRGVTSNLSTSARPEKSRAVCPARRGA